MALGGVGVLLNFSSPVRDPGGNLLEIVKYFIQVFHSQYLVPEVRGRRADATRALSNSERHQTLNAPLVAAPFAPYRPSPPPHDPTRGSESRLGVRT